MHERARQRAHLNGIELAYEVAGAGEPLLMISPVLADGFAPLVAEPALAARYQLITYHKRGWAESTHAPGPVSIADHAADAAALLDHLGVPSAHIAGHSSGGPVAMQLAVTRPALVRSLALLEPSLLSVPGAAAFVQQAGPAFDAYAAGDHETALARFLALVSGLEWHACRAMLERRAPGAVAAAIADADTFFGVELPGLGAWPFGAADAMSIRQPVLSVLGTDTEPLWVEIAALLRSWIPQLEECAIEGAGHLLQLQQPDAVAQGLAAFMARHPIASTSVTTPHTSQPDVVPARFTARSPARA